jgi:toxin ParE1/3/4
VIRRIVVYTPEAESDIFALYEYLADAASPAIATTFMRRVRVWLSGFDIASERGTLHDDIRAGLRTTGFERRITVAFTVDEAQVVVLRLFYGGQDWGDALTEA